MSVLRQSDHPARQGQARAGPAGARETGQQRARAVTTISPRSPLSHASKPINSPSRISKGINTIQSWGKQEHEELLSERDYGTTQTRLDLKEWLFRTLLLPLLLLLLLLPRKRIRVPEPTSQTLLNGLPVALVEDASHRNTCKEEGEI
jgi:hypothetical protein